MLKPPWYSTPVETLAFNSFVFHTCQLDNVVDEIVNNYHTTGQTSFTLDGLTKEDIEYIENKGRERLC